MLLLYRLNFTGGLYRVNKSSLYSLWRFDSSFLLNARRLRVNVVASYATCYITYRSTQSHASFILMYLAE